MQYGDHKSRTTILVSIVLFRKHKRHKTRHVQETSACLLFFGSSLEIFSDLVGVMSRGQLTKTRLVES